MKSIISINCKLGVKTGCILLGSMFLLEPIAYAVNDQVPTCGSFEVSSSGRYHFDRNLLVNWNGKGAPQGPSNHPGFGSEGQPRPMNAYAWSMASYGEHLYVGVMNRVNDRRNETGDISEGAEIWRYRPGDTVNSGTWEPEVSEGFSRLSNYGVRIMAVYNDQLFAGTFNLGTGTELWRRSQDVDDNRGQWEVIDDGGFGNAGNDSVRAMAVFNDKLYLGIKNNDDGASLYKFDAKTDAVSKVDGAEEGSTIKLADDVISELLVFGDYLWIFTWGESSLSAYRMDKNENIELVKSVERPDLSNLDRQSRKEKREELNKADVHHSNTGVLSAGVYNNKIYVGTVNLLRGAELFVLENTTSEKAEDIKWKRLGSNVFQKTETYLWRMQVYNDQLYIGTWNPFRRPALSENNTGATLYRMDKDERFCQIMGHERLLEEGFDRSENYGIRTMAEHKGRLFIGTAQPFKIKPGVDDTNAAQRAGVEVWEFESAK